MKSSNDTIKRLFEEAEELGVKIHMIESYDQIKYEIINLFLDHPNLDKSICVVDSENYDTQSLSNYLYEKGFDLLLPNEQVDYGEFIENLKNVQVGITSVDACVGETCTLIIRNRRPFFREVSLLPPVYIAVVRQDQIVISLEEALIPLKDDLLRGDGITFITGPSKTADIELNLVKGVHGPKEVHIFLLMDDLGSSKPS